MSLLEMKGIKKYFPGVVALQGASFSLERGEVHCLVGENGAGKSTLVKVLSGAYADYTGEIFFEGKPVRIDNPRKSRNLGIAAIQQHRDLVPTLSAVENIFLGQEITKGKSIDWKQEYTEAQRLTEMFGASFDITTPVSELSVSNQEVVAICKALVSNCKVLILDETAAPLDRRERAILFQKIRELADKGLGIIYISHDLEEIFEVGDRVTIMRDGKTVDVKKVKETNLKEIVKMMIGKEQQELILEKKECKGDVPLFRVDSLSIEEKVRQISFELREGEILGIYGLAGSGIEYIAYALFGVVPCRNAQITLEGKPLKIRSPQDALKAGLALIPDDRKVKGLIGIRSVGQNIVLSLISKFHQQWVSPNFVSEASKKYIKSLNIKTPSHLQRVEHLSGGNQQKVLIAKMLATDFKILLLVEPTEGIDVGTRYELYQFFRGVVRKARKGIILVSTDLDQIMTLSDRVLIVSSGKVQHECVPSQCTKEFIFEKALSSNGEG